MSIKKFIPEVWAEAIERENAVKSVFIEDCNREYEGKIEKKGDTVHILGVGKPTIKDMPKSGILEEPEDIPDSTVTLVVDQQKYFNYQVDNIDKAMAVGNVMAALNEETSEGISSTMDSFVAALAKDEAVKPIYTTPKVINASNVFDVIDEMALALYENNVHQSTKITLTIPPRFFMIFRKRYIELDTNNSQLIKGNSIAQYGNITIKQSNNCFREGGVDHVMMRTKRALAFVQSVKDVIAYQPEKSFKDAVKGYFLYGAKVVRPKEVFSAPIKYN